MSHESPVISKGILQKNQLAGNIALITGAGGGIGYETARALIWLGAKIVIAEIDKAKGKKAAMKLNKEFGEKSAFFVHTNIGNEKSVARLAGKIYKIFGKIDIIINNATVTPIGAVHTVGINKWDWSYGVNLRGPVLLISQFLQGMIERNSGIIVSVPSSGAAPYMGAYEVFKTAQVELANTLTAELENTNIITYSIGPGIVKTETAEKAIAEIAPLYGKSVAEFYKMSEHVLITVEEAGAGFAASVALASQYRGLEISSSQALTDAKIAIQEQKTVKKIMISEDAKSELFSMFQEIQKTFMEQLNGWNRRPVFERQWVLRDFKKFTGAAPEYFVEKLKEFENCIVTNELFEDSITQLSIEKISIYYQHQIDLLKGYEKNTEKVKEYSTIMKGWIALIEKFTQSTNLIIKKE